MISAYLAGLNALNRGASQLAVGHFQDALGQDPEHAQAHAFLAIALANTRRRYAALIEARRALELDPELAIAHVALGYAQMLHFDWRAADAAFADALALDPRNRDGLQGRAHIAELRKDAPRLAEALAEFREIYPDEAEGHILASDLELMRGNLPAAEEEARAALAMEPENVRALVALGMCKARQGQPAEARRLALIALQISPEHRSAHQLLAQAKVQERPIIGLWQRFSLWLSLGGMVRVVGVVIGAYLVFRVTDAVLVELGHEKIANLLRILWVALAICTWIASFQYHRLIEKDRKAAELDPTY